MRICRVCLAYNRKQRKRIRLRLLRVVAGLRAVAKQDGLVDAGAVKHIGHLRVVVDQARLGFGLCLGGIGLFQLPLQNMMAHLGEAQTH